MTKKKKFNEKEENKNVYQAYECAEFAWFEHIRFECKHMVVTSQIA